MAGTLKNISDLIPDPKNRRKHTARNVEMLQESLEKVGTGRSIVIDENNEVLAGNATIKAATNIGLTKVKVIEVDGTEVVAVRRTGLSDQQKRELALYDNRVAEFAEWDVEQLAEDIDAGLDLGLFFEPAELDELIPVSDVEGLTDPDVVPESRSTDIKTGDLFTLGNHRLLCGDSTNADDVARLMEGATVPLVHADPPYGMGKEKDGIANDNLYREKLDAFQMAWWTAVRPSLKDNASAYIWGTAEDLWRLWYVGGLADSERVTVRNEIIWNKISGMGMNSELHHQYATATERCLFLMLGQLFIGNQNVEDYWEGYEPLRSALCLEVEKAGWTKAEVNRITNTHMAGHWLTKSQFQIIGEENYGKLQVAAKGNAFLLSYFDFVAQFPQLRDNGNRRLRALAAEVRSKRPLFNNTHDNMTDVWEFPRVTGEDRHGHATPKPVSLVARAVKSSTPEKGAVVDPFCGTGTTIIAAEQLGRKCYAIEIDPSYCQVTIDRWESFTGGTATKAT